MLATETGERKGTETKLRIERELADIREHPGW